MNERNIDVKLHAELMQLISPALKKVPELEGSFNRLIFMDYDRLKDIGYSDHQIKALDLVKRIYQNLENEKFVHAEWFSRSIRDVYIDKFRSDIGHCENERFAFLFLNAQNQILKYHLGEIGTADRCVVFPRTIVQIALRYNATGVVIAHNHPGGSSQPSSGDRSLTKRLQDILSGVSINLVEHLIITSQGYFSFSDAGLL